MSGVIIWNYFSNSLLEISRTFVKSANMFGKVYFPRMVIPISIVTTEFLKFLIQFSVFLLIYSIFFFKGTHITINWTIIFLPLFILQAGLLALGFGIISASFTTKYRDLILAVNFLVQLWMYATPVVYPLSLLPEKWKFLSILNPMTQVIESFRLAMLGAGTVTATAIIINIFITLLVLITGIILFSRVEKNFMDTV
jgi:lipopolysaccharide transport system permease protein